MQNEKYKLYICMYVYIYINNIYAHMVGCMQYEGHRAKKDPEHAQRHKIEAGVATAAALGAGGYAYHEHHEQKEARYEGKDHRVPHGYYCN